MTSAAEYAEHSDELMARAYEDIDKGNRIVAQLHALDAQRTATLALAAATLEAAEANYEAHKRRLLEALNEEAENPSEADIDAFMGAIENPDADLCPGCGCTANVEHADGLVCEEYPSCGAEL